MSVAGVRCAHPEERDKRRICSSQERIEGGGKPPFLIQETRENEDEREKRMPEISFQAVIFSDLEPGTFRVLLRPYESNSARTYSAVMNAKRLVSSLLPSAWTRRRWAGNWGPKKRWFWR